MPTANTIKLKNLQMRMPWCSRSAPPRQVFDINPAIKHDAEMKILVFLSLLCALLLGTSACHTPPQSPASSNTELRSLSQQWDQLFNAGDSKKLAALYAEDAVSMPPNLPTLTGRKAIEADFKTFFADNIAEHKTSWIPSSPKTTSQSNTTLPNDFRPELAWRGSTGTGRTSKFGGKSWAWLIISRLEFG